MTGKQRSFLKKKAHHLPALLQIGKNGINTPFLKEMDLALTHHELVKLSVLESAQQEAGELIATICEELNASFVSHVGRKMVFYRESDLIAPKDRIHLPRSRE